MKLTIDILAIIICIFTIALIHRNGTIDKNKSNYFKNASILTIIILLLECITVICEEPTYYKFVWVNKIANALGFSLTPVVIIVLALLHWNRIQRYKKILSIPFLITLVMSIASVKTEWIFSVSAMNEYSRGKFFYIQTVCNGIYYIIFVYCALKELKTYDKQERLYLGMIFGLVFVGNVVQIVNSDILFIWGAVSLSILLYYVFLRELQFRYDPVTLTYNRMMFQKDMARLEHSKKVQVVVLDINNLKIINDTFGHAVGDYAISEGAKLIIKAMNGLGKVYRIGGDEFCVLIENGDREKTIVVLNEFNAAVKQYNIECKNEFQLVIAYGMSEYHCDAKRSIYEVFTQADNEMYKCKNKMKTRNKCEGQQIKYEKNSNWNISTC